MKKKNVKDSGVGAGLGALLGLKMNDQDCLQQLKKHGIINTEELLELLKRIKN